MSLTIRDGSRGLKSTELLPSFSLQALARGCRSVEMTYVGIVTSSSAARLNDDSKFRFHSFLIRKTTSTMTLTTAIKVGLLLSLLELSASFHNPRIVQNRKIGLKMTTDDSNLILVVGSANFDMTSTTTVLPTIGETVMGKGFATACGGKGGNQAVAAALCQFAPVSMVCRVGDDHFGEDLLANFKKVGVHYDEDKTVLPGVSSGVASIIVDENSGDNMVR